MKITHFNNSFISVRSAHTHIVCDPWIGSANLGGWHSFPEFSPESLRAYLSDCDWVYISHLHDDHFSTHTIRDLSLSGKKFLIKSFENRILARRLSSMGVGEIHELKSYEVKQIDDISLAILPQLSSSSSGLSDTVKFDMDTSIIFGDEDGAVFLNLVDNPYSIEDSQAIKAWCNDNFGEITIVALFAGAASEYPQAFYKINREHEKRRIVAESLQKIASYLSIYRPKYYFPAGGTYVIPGIMSPLNRFVAQPSIGEVRTLIRQADLDIMLIDIEGGRTAEISSDGLVVKQSPSITPTTGSVAESILAHSSDKYPYELSEFPCHEVLQELIRNAKINWSNAVSARNIVIHQSIRLIAHAPLSLSNEGSLKCKNAYDKFSVFEQKENEFGMISVHMDARLLMVCLKGLYPWNGALGSLCLFEREPNRHYPSDLWSLNYLICKSW